MIMGSGILKELMKEFESKRTVVYESESAKVYALRKINRCSLKEELELRVVDADGRLSQMYNVSVLEHLDAEKTYRELVGCAGLSVRDIQKMGKNILAKYEDIKRSTSEEMGIEEVLETVYDLLEDKGCTTEEIKSTDENLDRSILIKDGYYLMKAKALREIADEVEVNYSLLRRELVSLGFIETSRGRDSVSVSINGRKMKLIKINRDKFKRIFGGVDKLEVVSGL